METFFRLYTVAWGVLCLIAVVVYLKYRASFALSRASYWKFVFTPWKIITFFIAVCGLILIGTYGDAPDLDRFDVVVMAILTFLTAPWVVGMLFRIAKGESSPSQAYVVVCMWFFCGSWVFDSYILIKDGRYPIMWPTYLLATMGLYILGGMLWNLDWKAERGTIFAFAQDDWPSPPAQTVFHKLMWVALIFMVAVAGVFLWVFWDSLLRTLQ